MHVKVQVENIKIRKRKIIISIEMLEENGRKNKKRKQETKLDHYRCPTTNQDPEKPKSGEGPILLLWMIWVDIFNYPIL